ncbi:MAG: carbohydrate kinase family protein [Myxococcales bacterium]|nr:MAG: carbohydrate kinase family protein [Myxococcales bacterium]
MTILVSGSLALDHIMVFPDRFKDHILPDKLHILNVSFNIDSLRTHFGGVAGNIAYHLRLLGEDPLIVATAGSDFGPYAEWLDGHGIRRDGSRILEELRTAQGFVTTDLDDNQIWAFYVGAMGRALEAPLPPADDPLRLAIVSSDSREAMLARARELKRRGVPTYVDPSHALPILSRDELVELIEGAAGYVVNDYEWSLTLDKTGMAEAEIAQRCAAVVVTRGEQGSTIREGGRSSEIPPVPARQIVDPTACGDAYRAGLLAGRARGFSFETAGRMGSLLGSYVVEVEGPQSLRLDAGEFEARFAREFGRPLG